MVKYLHLALDEELHEKLIIIKGNMTWIAFLEDKVYGPAHKKVENWESCKKLD